MNRTEKYLGAIIALVCLGLAVIAAAVARVWWEILKLL